MTLIKGEAWPPLFLVGGIPELGIKKLQIYLIRDNGYIPPRKFWRAFQTLFEFHFLFTTNFNALFIDRIK